MFGSIKEWLSRAFMSKEMRELEEEEKRCLALTVDQLLAMSDGELLDAVCSRVGLASSEEDAPRTKRVFGAVYNYGTDIKLGDFHDYMYVTEASEINFLPEALEDVGAADHRELFTRFMSATGIDAGEVTDEMKEQYPFAEYDRAFAAMKSPLEYLIHYTREHIWEL